MDKWLKVNTCIYNLRYTKDIYIYEDVRPTSTPSIKAVMMWRLSMTTLENPDDRVILMSSQSRIHIENLFNLLIDSIACGETYISLEALNGIIMSAHAKDGLFGDEPKIGNICP